MNSTTSNSTSNLEAFLAVMHALQTGDIDVIRQWIDNGADVNMDLGDGITVLTIAAGYDHLDIMKLLIEHGADVNSRDRLGQTIITSCAHRNHPETIKLLIHHGADVNASSNLGSTALMNAADYNAIEVMELLIASGADINAQDKEGWTALISCIGKQQFWSASLLIERSADVNIARSDGVTPLMAAVKMNSNELVRQLIQKGADVHARDIHGNTAVSIAVMNQNMAMVHLLNAAQSSFTENLPEDIDPSKAELIESFIGAAICNDTVMLREMLSKGMDVNCRGKLSATALHKAARANAVEAVKLLLESGANVTLRDSDGKSAMFEAVCRGHEAVIRLLEQKGLKRYED